MISLHSIAEKYGTPLYVYQLDELAKAWNELAGCLPQPCTIYFSLKSNPHPEVVAALRGTGCGAEISSAGELHTALNAGFTGTQCLVTGPGRTDAETTTALIAGVRLFSVESVHQLQQLDRLATDLNARPAALLRLNPGTTGRAGLRMTGKASQFGFDPASLTQLEPHLDNLHSVDVSGAHMFSATNMVDEDALVESMEVSISQAARLRDMIDLRYLDLGGGFAAPYATPGPRPSYPNLASRSADLLDRALPGWRAGHPEVLFESGRFITAGCGTLLCRVLDVKQSYGRTFVVVDAGVNHLGGLAATGRVIGAKMRPTLNHGQPVSVDLVGPLCTPADILARDTTMTEPAPGDLVEIPNVGAYGLTTGLLGFLSHPLPVELALRRDEIVSATRIHLHRNAIEEDAHVVELG
ncbi:type III PLP-dependent enzyme [Nocardia sp. NPDC051321]|uniref:type III PLP-dependent enzyme n=1 Tax=Nocardia sp. NPDC051321 TaxID=3364323 RepID=UPI00378B8200